MKKHQVTFSGNTITVDGRHISVEYPVAEAVLVDDKVIVLYDPDSYTKTFGQFANLVGLTFEGKHLWDAELPTNESGDHYYKISSKYPLIAYSAKSFECEIDSATGKLKRRVFFK